MSIVGLWATCYCCATADILRKLLQQCFLFSLLWLHLGNSQVSNYRTIGPTLVAYAKTKAQIAPLLSLHK